MKRILSALLAALLLVTLLTGCDGRATTATTQPTQADTRPADATQETDPAAEPASLVIHEVMADNRSLVLGHNQDWVELYNPEDYDVPLDGYYLTDDPQKPQLLSLSGKTVASGGYLCVVLDGDAPFRLAEVGETVYLTCGGQTLSQLTFPESEKGESYDADGACRWPTPGFGNSEEGYRQYLQSQTLPELVISEAMPFNLTQLPLKGLYYDLLEVTNNTSQSVQLGDYYLTNSYEAVKRYQFPNVALEPGASYVVYCSGQPELGEDHAPFTLSQDGQTLYLAKKGQFTHTLTMPSDLKPDESFGLSQGLPVYLQSPSFGQPNGEGILAGVPAPQFSIPSGMYKEAVQITLTGTGNIYYTLDGSRPTTRSKAYTEPIPAEDVTTIRAMCEVDGRTSAVVNASYVIGKEHDLPVLVISMTRADQNYLFEYIQSKQEHEAVATLFEDGEEKFTVPMGIRLHGNDSRKGRKKNFQLRFRSEYGASKLHYRLFDDRDIDEFDSLILKGGSEDWRNGMMRDELTTLIANGTSALYTQAMKPVVVYLGGEYWGVHYLRERFSDQYVASHLNVSPESVDILFSNRAYVQVGSNKDFLALREYCQTHDMSQQEHYNYLAQRIDVNSLIDWYVVRSWSADNDYANIRRFRSSEHDGKWRWMFFDLDWSYMYWGSIPLTLLLTDYGGDAVLINALISSDAGRDAFLSRYAYMMRTALNQEHAHRCLDEIVNAIASEMPRDRERWNVSMTAWENNVASIRKYTLDENRHRILIGDMKNYFGLSDEEVAYYFGDLLTE